MKWRTIILIVFLQPVVIALLIVLVAVSPLLLVVWYIPRRVRYRRSPDVDVVSQDGVSVPLRWKWDLTTSGEDYRKQKDAYREWRKHFKSEKDYGNVSNESV